MPSASNAAMPWRTSDAPSSGLPLLGEDPTAEDQTVAAPHRHVVLGRKRDHRLGVAAGRRHVTKQVGKLASAAVAQDVAGRVGVLQPGGVPGRLARRAPRLVRVAHDPQHEGQEGQPRGAGIGDAAGGQVPVALRIVEGRDRLELRAGLP